jgi:hypothetical protein
MCTFIGIQDSVLPYAGCMAIVKDVRLRGKSIGYRRSGYDRI